MDTTHRIFLSLLVSILIVGVFTEVVSGVGVNTPLQYQTLWAWFPQNGGNWSGSINLSAVLSPQFVPAAGAPSAANWSVGNITFMFQLVSNFSIWNVTLYNITANQSMWGNQTPYNFNTTNGSCNTYGCNTHPGSRLADGRYNLSVIMINVTDLDGAKHYEALTNYSVGVDIIIDNTIPVVSPVALSYTGIFNFTSNNATFNVSVSDFSIQSAPSTAAPGFVVFDFDNASGNDFNVTPINISGHWAYYGVNISSLHAGEHTVRIHANDTAKGQSGGAANNNRSQTITFTLNDPHNVTWQTSDGDGWGYSTDKINFNATIGNRVANKTMFPITNFILMFDNASKTGVMNVSNTTGPEQGYYWNITFNVSTLPVGTHTVKIFANDSLGHNNITQSITFAINNSAHNVTWHTADGDGWGYSTDKINFNVTIKNGSNARITDIVYMFDNASRSGVMNVTNTTGAVEGLYYNLTFNVSTLPVGTHTVKIFANDSLGHNNITQSITFAINNSAHNVTWHTSDADGWGWSTNKVNLNVTIRNGSHARITDVVYMFDNASRSGVMNVTNTTGAVEGLYYNLTFNVSTLPVGTHTVKIFANDSLGHNNITQSITFAINNSAHNVTWHTADGDGWGWNTALINFNVTIKNGSHARITDVVYMFDNASKTGVTNYTNRTGAVEGFLYNITFNISTLPVGTHTVKVFSNDSLGHNNITQSITFAINNTPQNVTWDASYGIVSREVRHGLISGQNFTAINTTVYFNVSIYNITHAPPFTVIFQFDNGTGTDFNLSNGSNVVAGQYWNLSYNLSALVEGNHTITVFVNNSLGHFNRTEKISFFVDKTNPSVTVSCSPSAATVGDTVSCTCTGTETAGNSSGIKTSARFSGSGSATESTTATGTSGTSQTCYAEDYAGNSGTATGSWTVSAASSGGGGGGGSGGGTSSGVTGAFAKEVWTSINAGETAKVEVTNGAIGVTEVSFSVGETTYGAWLKVEKKDSLPSDISSFSGKIYKTIEVTESNIKKALTGTAKIEFKVTKVWLSEQGLGKTDVALHRYVDSKWNELKTTAGEEDGTYQYYSAETPGFSYFVIGQKIGAAAGEAVEKAVGEEVAEKAAGEEAVTGEEATGEEIGGEEVVSAEGKGLWTWVIVVLVIIALVAIAFWLKKRK